MKRDGKNPVWLSAYASYGFTMEPNFRPERLAWLERGGVLAFANPRGGGVLGNDWYLAGKGIRKINTWLDVIACAEYLVAQGWTNPRQHGFSGRSAGGLLAHRVLTARPAPARGGVGKPEVRRPTDGRAPGRLTGAAAAGLRRSGAMARGRGDAQCASLTYRTGSQT